MILNKTNRNSLANDVLINVIIELKYLNSPSEKIRVYSFNTKGDDMAKKQDKEASFEETIKQLEAIVTQLENGDLPLDEALNEFEKGIKLARSGQKQLNEAEQRIQILLTENSDAQLSEFSIDNNE